MRAAYPPDASFWVFVVPLLVQGVAMGTFFVALVTISLDRLPPERVPAASGLNNFLRIISSVLPLRSHPPTGTGARRSISRGWWSRCPPTILATPEHWHNFMARASRGTPPRPWCSGW